MAFPFSVFSPPEGSVGFRDDESEAEENWGGRWGRNRPRSIYLEVDFLLPLHSRTNPSLRPSFYFDHDDWFSRGLRALVFQCFFRSWDQLKIVHFSTKAVQNDFGKSLQSSILFFKNASAITAFCSPRAHDPLWEHCSYYAADLLVFQLTLYLQFLD